MLELIFRGFVEWSYGLVLECWEYFSSALLGVMSMDFAYLKSHIPVLAEIQQILLAVGWLVLSAVGYMEKDRQPCFSGS